MAISRAVILQRVQRRVNADLAEASLAINDVHEESIYGWANEFCPKVIDLIKDPIHFPSLNVTGTSLTFSTGSAALPSSFQLPRTVKVSASYTDLNGDTVSVTSRKAMIYTDPNDFHRFDSSSFVLTPSGKRPIVLITDKIYVKPTTITSGTIDYIKSHPTIDGSSGSLFDDKGDTALILFILEAYYDFIEAMDAKAMVQKEIEAMKYVD